MASAMLASVAQMAATPKSVFLIPMSFYERNCLAILPI